MLDNLVVLVIRLFLLVLMFIWSLQSYSAELPNSKAERTFIVGSEKIDYFPHYNFQNYSDKGYAWALLEAFAQTKNYTFIYQSLPIKRLHLELKKGTVDFVYPDNPKWNPNNALVEKHFSVPLTIAMGGTMVRKSWLPGSIDKFNALNIPHGFTPVKWLDLITSGKVKLVQVADSRAALELVIKNRVTGADIEYHVAKHILGIINKQDALVMATELPFDTVGFQLSTIQFPHIVDELSDFIVNNEPLITNLKQRYGLQSPESILDLNQYNYKVVEE